MDTAIYEVYIHAHLIENKTIFGPDAELSDLLLSVK